MAEAVYTPRIILRRTQVQARTGLSRSGIYQKIAEGSFPRQISLGPRSVGWLESSIEQWIQGRVELSNQAKGE